jgi:hypothetical protein
MEQEYLNVDFIFYKKAEHILIPSQRVHQKLSPSRHTTSRIQELKKGKLVWG